MHVDEVLRAGCLVQRVDVLGDGQHVTVLALEPGKSEMGCVGPRLFMPGATEIVKAMHRTGSRAKASGVATSSILKFSQSPPGPRKVPSPLSADSPAPVRMTML